MARTPRDRLNKERDTIQSLDNAACRDRLLDLTDALDEATVSLKYHDPDGTVRSYPPRSVERYVQSLRLCVQRGLDLTTCTSEEFNAFIDRQHDERGLSKTTLQGYQEAGVKFYTYHSDLGVEPTLIHHYTEQSEPRHDEQDVFTKEDISALRTAIGQTQNPVRNRALFELLVYTGQRIRALVTLRVKDVDTQEGYLYLNAEAEGLKGAVQRGRKRPLFGARKYVREWLQYHPTGEPDDYVFVGDPSHHKTMSGSHLNTSGFRQILERVREIAGVDKPVNPHNFRHYFVTVMKRDYELSDAEVKMLMGVSKSSEVMTSTYNHVTEGELIRSSEMKLGVRESDENRFAPPVCPTCDEPLEPEWRRCPACDELFAPQERIVAEQLSELGVSASDVAIAGLDPDSDVSLSREEIVVLRSMIESFREPESTASTLVEDS